MARLDMVYNGVSAEVDAIVEVSVQLPSTSDIELAEFAQLTKQSS